MKKEGSEYDLGDLIRDIEERTDCTELEIKGVLKTAFLLIAEALAVDRRVELHDIGVFSLKHRKERVYKFGENEFVKPEHDQVKFKAAPALAKDIFDLTNVFVD